MSEAESTPDPFALLDPALQRALWEAGWASLRPIQQDAILAWNEPARPDLLIMAQTAGGKTEAAFLPVLSQVGAEAEGSVRAMYLGPLKALINDQFERVEHLCRHMDVPVHRWHGDVNDDAKRRLVEAPSGVLLITPESLESLLINRTPLLGRLLGGLRAIVIDELHAFLEGERGLHLASLLSRVDDITRASAGTSAAAPGMVRARRVGLSATIGEPAAAARYLNPDAPERVRIIEGKGEQKELLARVHWYAKGEAADAVARTRKSAEMRPSAQDGERPTERADGPTAHTDPGEDSDAEDAPLRAMAGDFVRLFHDSTNLVFCNSKADIEVLADAANALCRDRGLEERFHVHHGSLARTLREDAEAEMKEPAPDTAICSSTLEMGIDIGSVRTVGQVGAPWSVASLKQRVGRSGRKDGQARRLRVFLADDAEPASPNPEKRLPLDLLRTVAILELMLTDRWVEPTGGQRLDLSTLTQQIVSVVAQTGGIRAADLHERLCARGAFRNVGAGLLARVLRSLGSRDVLEQTSGGELILGLAGERIRSERDFYAAFATPREFVVRAGDSVVGTLPLVSMPRAGDHLVLGGRRWQVESVEAGRMEVMVVPARGVKRPAFSGSAGQVHPCVAGKMLEVLRGTAPAPHARGSSTEQVGPPAGGPGAASPEVRFACLDPGALAALRSAREVAARDGLGRRRIMETEGRGCVCFTWAGGRVQTTLAAMLMARGIPARCGEVSVSCDAEAERVRELLRGVLADVPEHAGRTGAERAGESRAGEASSIGTQARSLALVLARHVQPKVVRKFDHLLDEELLDESIAADRLDVVGAVAVVREIVEER